MSRTLVRSLLVVSSLVLVSFLICSSAFAHDAPIRQGGYKNLAGEWCCGAGDCGVVAPNNVKVGSAGYALSGPVTYGASATGNAADGPTWREDVNEVVPYSKALPSPDGAYWRCKRPDGSPRCFFAPPSGS